MNTRDLVIAVTFRCTSELELELRVIPLDLLLVVTFEFIAVDFVAVLTGKVIPVPVVIIEVAVVVAATVSGKGVPPVIIATVSTGTEEVAVAIDGTGECRDTDGGGGGGGGGTRFVAFKFTSDSGNSNVVLKGSVEICVHVFRFTESTAYVVATSNSGFLFKGNEVVGDISSELIEVVVAVVIFISSEIISFFIMSLYDLNLQFQFVSLMNQAVHSAPVVLPLQLGEGLHCRH